MLKDFLGDSPSDPPLSLGGTYIVHTHQIPRRVRNQTMTVEGLRKNSYATALNTRFVHLLRTNASKEEWRILKTLILLCATSWITNLNSVEEINL